MTQEEAIDKIQEGCKQIALQMMKIQPSIPVIEDGEIKSDLIRSAHQLTVELEVIKKKLIQLQQRDGSTEL